MRWSFYGLLIVVLSAASQSSADAEPVEFDLGGEWTLTQVGSALSVPATVPGCVHTDLLSAGKIPDPFFRDNQKALQWISDSAWSYTRTFQAPASLISHRHVLLRCEGLDTVTAITVNGQPVGQTDNMFRTYEFDVKPLLKPGDNSIEVTFSPISPYIQALIKNARGPNSAVRGMSNLRKAPYSNGWDFAPRFLTCGIFKRIELLAFDQARLTRVATRTDLSSAGNVTLEVDAYTQNSAGVPLRLNATLALNGVAVATRNTNIDLLSGHLLLEVPNPQLWWPNGMGAQPLYHLTILLTDLRGSVIDRRTIRIGLRKIELLAKTSDSPLRLAVNGRVIFVKGANWVPCDMFASRVTTSQLRRYVADAAAVHMNMLRCWGGGYYEEDAFYDACDEMGIMVWSEFKFACAMYPSGNAGFVDSVKKEVTDQVTRLQNHPCIAVWSGNNEVTSLITGYKILSRKDYDYFFHDIIGTLVQSLVPGANYVGGSPEAGDEHNWWVWHVGADFEKYLESHGWMTEFGFQSYPCPATVESYTDPADRTSVLSPVMKAHEHNGNGRGSEMIVDMMGRYFRPAADFNSSLWLSQINQAYGVTMGIEHWRSDWPKSSGALVWQYDDSWPGPTWASVDYFGRWKALHYKLREAYAPQMVTTQYNSDSGEVQITVCNDLPFVSSCRLNWRLTNTVGTSLLSGSSDIRLPAGVSCAAGPQLKLADVIAATGPKNVLLWITLSNDQQTLSRKTVWFVRPKELNLIDPQLSFSAQPKEDGFDITLSAVHPALWAWADLVGDPDARYSDNFVHILPGSPAILHVVPSHKVTLEYVAQNIRVRSLFSTYTQEHPAE